MAADALKTYAEYRDALAGQQFPLAFVDLDLLDENSHAIAARAGDMPICVATKSVRCVALLQRILAASPQFHRLMAYSCREAVLLAGRGFDRILVAYPVLQEAEVRLDPALPFSTLADALHAGKSICLMVDDAAQVDFLQAHGAREGVTIPLCMDLDLSTSFPGLHFGVRRSPIHTARQAVALWRHIQRCPNVRLEGLMGYEAQIAGVQDRAPGAAVKSMVIRALKKRALPQVRQRRAEVVHALRESGAELHFVNGGGTGSIESTIQEADVVTEVTAGSGFYAPLLFDGYDQFRHLPAAGFALEITRAPTPGIFTCHGGGYIASGPAGADRLPCPHLPQGAQLLPLEGAGEVQTPIQYTGPEPLGVGSPVFFRHAKAGELCERFPSLHLLAGGHVVDIVPTYRGEGWCFL